ncbi:MAG: PadR family transcriptional regulator [Bacteroidota bacterium]
MSYLSAINLVLLGFLMDESMSAYDLDKLIARDNIKEMVKISTPAVYKNLLKLNESGYLAAQTIKEGEMPEKTIYRITDLGRQYFMELMYKYAGEKARINFDLNALIINLEKIDKEKALRMLGNIRNGFYFQQKIVADQLLSGQMLPLTSRAIIRQSQLVNQALINWIEELIHEFSK